MHIAVCIKQIFDPEVASSVFQVDEARNAVVPIPGLQRVISPFDEQAIEAALRIREAGGDDVRITVLTLGSGPAREALKQGLSLGADEGVFVDAGASGEADSHTTAFALAAAIERCGEVDLVLTGRQAADRDAGVVGAGIAACLSRPLVNWARSISVHNGTATVERVLDDGVETVEVDLPAVVSVSNELGAPRKASLRETMRAARKPVTDLTLAELGFADGGEPVARQSLERLYIPAREGKCRYVEGATAQEIAANLVRELQGAKLL